MSGKYCEHFYSHTVQSINSEKKSYKIKNRLKK